MRKLTKTESKLLIGLLVVILLYFLSNFKSQNEIIKIIRFHFTIIIPLIALFIGIESSLIKSRPLKFKGHHLLFIICAEIILVPFLLSLLKENGGAAVMLIIAVPLSSFLFWIAILKEEKYIKSMNNGVIPNILNKDTQ